MKWFTKLLEALSGAYRSNQGHSRPRVVDEALEQDYDLEEYRRRGGGVAPPDAPKIDDGGI